MNLNNLASQQLRFFLNISQCLDESNCNTLSTHELIANALSRPIGVESHYVRQQRSANIPRADWLMTIMPGNIAGFRVAGKIFAKAGFPFDMTVIAEAMPAWMPQSEASPVRTRALSVSAIDYASDTIQALFEILCTMDLGPSPSMDSLISFRKFLEPCYLPRYHSYRVPVIHLNSFILKYFREILRIAPRVDPQCQLTLQAQKYLSDHEPKISLQNFHLNVKCPPKIVDNDLFVDKQESLLSIDLVLQRHSLIVKTNKKEGGWPMMTYILRDHFGRKFRNLAKRMSGEKPRGTFAPRKR